jgi:hypothetical protein
MMPTLPWETGSFAPWQVGNYFTDSQGVTWQTFADPASPSGYTIKRVDANGTSFNVGPTPNDPNAAANAWENSPYGQRYAKYEEGQARQNSFNNQIKLDTLGVSKQKLDNDYRTAMATARNDAEKNEITRQYQQGLIRIAEGDLEVKRGDLALRGELGRGDLALRGELGRGDLALRQDLGYGDLALRQGTLGLNTLQLGSQLRGPRDWLQYQRAASGANQNPVLTGAVDAWASLTQNKPTGLGAWGGGEVQPFDLNALSSDFGGPGAGQNGPMYTPEQQAFMQTADQAAKSPNQLGAGWWESKSPDQQQMYVGAWDVLGHSPDTVLSRYKNTRIGQSGRGSRAA